MTTKPKSAVTEFDLRMPEFRDAGLDLDELEFRDDGKIVRKDRWESGIRSIVGHLGWSRRQWEVPEVVAEVARRLPPDPADVPCVGCTLLAEGRCQADVQFKDFSCREPALPEED